MCMGPVRCRYTAPTRWNHSAGHGTHLRFTRRAADILSESIAPVVSGPLPRIKAPGSPAAREPLLSNKAGTSAAAHVSRARKSATQMDGALVRRRIVVWLTPKIRAMFPAQRSRSHAANSWRAQLGRRRRPGFDILREHGVPLRPVSPFFGLSRSLAHASSAIAAPDLCSGRALHGGSAPVTRPWLARGRARRRW